MITVHSFARGFRAAEVSGASVGLLEDPSVIPWEVPKPSCLVVLKNPISLGRTKKSIHNFYAFGVQVVRFDVS